MTTISPTRRKWGSGQNATPDRVCRECGASFYTQTGLSVHAEQGCRTAVSRAWTRRTKPHPSLVETGRDVTARTNARVLRCDVCGMESRPGPLTLHQRATGHVGWAELLP